MTGTKIYVVVGVGFIIFVGLILLVLYYPKEMFDKDLAGENFLDAAQSPSPEAGEDFDFRLESSELAKVGKAVEDLGVLFLAFLAVCCVVIGLGCIFCACCVVAP